MELCLQEWIKAVSLCCIDFTAGRVCHALGCNAMYISNCASHTRAARFALESLLSLCCTLDALLFRLHFTVRSYVLVLLIIDFEMLSGSTQGESLYNHFSVVQVCVLFVVDLYAAFHRYGLILSFFLPGDAITIRDRRCSMDGMKRMKWITVWNRKRNQPC